MKGTRISVILALAVFISLIAAAVLPDRAEAYRYYNRGYYRGGVYVAPYPYYYPPAYYPPAYYYPPPPPPVVVAPPYPFGLNIVIPFRIH